METRLNQPEFLFFVREEYADGCHSGQSAATLDDAIAEAGKSVKKFVCGEHQRYVNAMTVIVGERVPASVYGFRVHKRFKIQKDGSLL